MAGCVTASTSVAASARAIRVLRWSFQRPNEHLCCELGLDRDEAVYELSIDASWASQPRTERFRDVQAALQRQASVERLLVEEGWSLERFESTTTFR